MPDLSGRRIALVGGAGFIGHHLALTLKERGADVHVIDGLEVNNLLSYLALPSQNPNRDLYLKIINQRLRKLEAAGVPLHVQDAREYDKLSRILGEIEPQTVVQLAAVAHANRSNKDPMSTFDHSLRTLENALDYSRDKAEHFVYFSSSMVYGNFLTPEVDETHPLDPIGIYGALKLAGERMCIAYKQVFDLDYTIIRPSALYGPGCVSRRVSQVFIENALVGDKLRVDGLGEERIDFSWVEDVIEGTVRAIEHPAGRNEAFNITTGGARTLRELIEIVQEHFPEVEVEYVERDALRPFRGTLKIDKAREAIGYDPRTKLEDGLDRYVAWYRDLVSDGVLSAR
ncbi:NAD-dependent epimerase/dehydratase family protein [Capillimicrobium parvum]|uniref:dTDP-glucose 4,6-dehydratase 2 n=1 Tax=Capillimicrobium parvum TaxID=2884022 RepID=A0A9E6Y295_9ACTN|nr:NAD(P)-dependent oxidoreductase [Capillimicrobium parvum]UGS38720.1 dTDP-glucose 4,6-dehydratase 2 [Capillimicrobium parvum]